MSPATEYEVLFYKRPNGNCPTIELLLDLPVKVRAKFEKWIKYLEVQGPDLTRPYADVLRDKIRELRLKFGSNQYRFLYFFHGKAVVFTHAFVKKTDKVPEEEIEKAIRFMNDFLVRTTGR